MNKTIGWVVIIPIIIGAVWWAANRAPATPPASNEPVKIGAVLPMTGIAAIVGETEKRGIQLAVEEINENGGISGRELEVIFEDDRTDPKNTVSAVNKLAGVDKVNVIIGGTWDFLANAAIPVVETNKIVLISPSALPDTLEHSSPYFFATHSPVASNEAVIASFLSKFNRPKIVTISVNNLWGKAHLGMFKKAAEKSGSELIKEVIVPNFDNNDIQRELSLIKPLQPDVVIIALNFGDSVSFLNKKAQLGVAGKVLADFHVEDNFNQGNLEQNLVKDITLFVFSDPKGKFIESYSRKFGEKPKTYADTAYDAVYAIKLAIENSGGKYSTADILRGLKEIKNYDGASGLIDFSVNNYSQNKKSILKVFGNGQFVKLEN